MYVFKKFFSFENPVFKSYILNSHKYAYVKSGKVLDGISRVKCVEINSVVVGLLIDEVWTRLPRILVVDRLLKRENNIKTHF